VNCRLRFALLAALPLALLLPSTAATAQDSATAAGQEVRIQQLEGQIRDLNGQIEQLTYQVQQLNTRLDKLVGDVDFRLRELEGGGSATSMSTDDAGDGSDATQTATRGSTPEEEAGAAPSQPTTGGGTYGSAGQPQVLGTMPQSDFDAQRKRLNPNADPAAASKAAGAAQPAAGQGEEQAAAQPYTLQGATPDEQYQYAFDLLRQNKYTDAEQALSTFVEQNPDHPLAGNANYWLGETYYVRQDYENAALTFAEGSQRYPKSGKAPDALLKLGMSLAALGETADACQAFAELAARYPNASSSVKQRSAKEQAKNGCE
jgi:tol-pal system protein YbgF